MQRRGFAKRLAALFVGGILGAVPFGSALAFLLDPLRRKSSDPGLLKVTALDALPEGEPQKHTIIADRDDAWNHYENEPIGAVYLIRNGSAVTAFQVKCPHAGCFVDFDATADRFECPCHRSAFKLDGSRDLAFNPNTPAARGLDALDVSVRDGHVYVRYQEFKGLIAEKQPIA